jgi:tetratricopeptide (TPR) repeat protein/tRNA A-37 threonylcarbamoyl transferase component Bud32
MDFISRDALIQAMSAWAVDKVKGLGQILMEQKVLTSERHALLEALVQEHLKQHGNDPQQSLAAVSSLGSVREELEQIPDPGLQASLVHVSAARRVGEDSWASHASAAVGTPTSSGLRFRILRPHAKGGLGQISVALDQELQREVAFKEIQDRHADDPDKRCRFVLEAEITGGLEHPGIVPVYGLGHYADGRPYYAMRFIKGDSLKDVIDRFHRKEGPERDPGERTVEFRKVLGRFVDVCNAMAYAHSRGVLHRDLKPGNIMLGKYGETMVVDWGLAKPLEKTEPAQQLDEQPLRPSSQSGTAETVAGVVRGTPSFMSPEQAAGRLDLPGPASDIYSLGATLYALVTGQPPFTDPDVDTVLRKVQQGDFAAPRQKKRDVPAALEAICLKAMALRPADRYAAPRALADDIEHWLADEPVTAFREPWTARAGRWARRRRTVVTSAVAALLVGAIGLVTATVLLAQANERERAARELAQANEKAAAEREAETKAVLEFVENRVFAAARPEGESGGLGHAVMLREAVEAALPFVAKGFTDQPLIEARLRMTLGTSFLYLGDAKTAAEQAEAARALYARHRGPDHPDTLASMNNLANSYADLGRLTDALKLREQTLTLRKAKLGPAHPDTLLSMNNLANSYTALGRLTDALKLREQTLTLMKAKPGPDHPDTLASMNNLAVSYADLGRHADALKLHEQTLALRKAKLGPDHPDTLASMNNLAVSYAALGRHAEALKLCEQTLALRKAKLGPDHPNTLLSMNNLAVSYAALGRHADAVKLREQMLALRKAKLGPDHPDTLASKQILAQLRAGDAASTTSARTVARIVCILASPLGNGPLVAVSARVAGKPFNRSIWVHTGGAFIKTEGTAWVECGKAADRLYFTERNRNLEYVELYDQSRELTARLYATRMYWITRGQSNWNFLYWGYWEE